MRHLFVLLAGLCACMEPTVDITAEPIKEAAQSVTMWNITYWDVVPPLSDPPSAGETGGLPGQVLRIDATAPVYVELANPSYCYGHETIVEIEGGHERVSIVSDSGAPIAGDLGYYFTANGPETLRFVSVGDGWDLCPDVVGGCDAGSGNCLTSTPFWGVPCLVDNDCHPGAGVECMPYQCVNGQCNYNPASGGQACALSLSETGECNGSGDCCHPAF